MTSFPSWLCLGCMRSERACRCVYSRMVTKRELKILCGVVQRRYDPESECVICMGEACCVHFPCGHAGCCRGCADNWRAKGGSCPVCRAVVGRGDV